VNCKSRHDFPTPVFSKKKRMSKQPTAMDNQLALLFKPTTTLPAAEPQSYDE
jgi:hypothetical protein